MLQCVATCCNTATRFFACAGFSGFNPSKNTLSKFADPQVSFVQPLTCHAYFWALRKNLGEPDHWKMYPPFFCTIFTLGLQHFFSSCAMRLHESKQLGVFQKWYFEHTALEGYRPHACKCAQVYFKEYAGVCYALSIQTADQTPDGHGVSVSEERISISQCS